MITTLSQHVHGTCVVHLFMHMYSFNTHTTHMSVVPWFFTTTSMTVIGPVSGAGRAKMSEGLAGGGFYRAGFDYEDAHLGWAEYPRLRIMRANTFSCVGIVQQSDPDFSKA